MRNPNFHVKNLMHFDLLRYKVRLAGAGDPSPVLLPTNRAHSYMLEHTNSSSASVTLDGHGVQQIDFTNGGKNNKLNMPNMGSSWNDDSSIEYIDSRGNSHVLVNLKNNACYEIEDSGGIDGSPPAKLSAFFKKDPLNPYGAESLFIHLDAL